MYRVFGHWHPRNNFPMKIRFAANFLFQTCGVMCWSLQKGCFLDLMKTEEHRRQCGYPLENRNIVGSRSQLVFRLACCLFRRMVVVTASAHPNPVLDRSGLPILQRQWKAWILKARMSSCQGFVHLQAGDGRHRLLCTPAVDRFLNGLMRAS